MQSSSTILLIRPKSFAFNYETAVNNAFQEQPEETAEDVRSKAIKEFNEFQQTLIRKGVNVLVFDDTREPAKPDAVFPNNWVSFHPNGTVVLYPMFAPVRRNERRLDIIDALRKDFDIRKVIDLSHYEEQQKFLEGTGSIVFDHRAKVAYACLSPRTDGTILRELCEKLGYRELLFHAYDHGRMQIYHTNVMMCIAERFAVICLESIHSPRERELVETTLEISGHEVIPISISQVNHFAGNMLSVRSSSGELLVMSGSAFDCLTPEQKEKLASFCELVPIPIRTIESIGGGSARCMMAEVFLPRKGSQQANS